MFLAIKQVSNATWKILRKGKGVGWLMGKFKYTLKFKCKAGNTEVKGKIGKER